MLNPQALIAPSGRVFVRHPSGMGSVMFFDDRGIQQSVLVLDAKYRTRKQFGLYGVVIPEFQDSQLEEPDRYWLNYSTERSTEAPDSWINKNILWDPMTSRERCDVWMKYNEVAEELSLHKIPGCLAVQHCRRIRVNGIPCDLPNIQTLVRIFVDRVTIDQMDPTVEEYSRWSLNEWDFFAARFAWSSTEYSNGSCCHVHYNGFVRTLHGDRFYEYSVIPILELR